MQTSGQFPAVFAVTAQGVFNRTSRHLRPSFFGNKISTASEQFPAIFALT